MGLMEALALALRYTHCIYHTRSMGFAYQCSSCA